jgi:hypothetical protein
VWHLQVLGFVVDMKTLGKITLAVGSFFATVVPVVVALSKTDEQREESMGDSGRCGLSDRQQAALVALMASFNSTCTYNVSVNGYTLP